MEKYSNGVEGVFWYAPKIQAQITNYYNIMGLPSSWLGEMQHKWGQQGKPGRSSYGFCLRNEHGNLIYAEANFIGEAKNTMAEARAIELAPTYYGSNGYSRILLETDSLAMCDIIQKTWKIPWEIADIVEEIYKLFGDTNIQTKHVYWEANQLAKSIANIEIEKEDKHVFTIFSQLPSMARRILNIDK